MNSVKIAGEKVDIFTQDSLIETIMQSALKRQTTIFSCHNLFSLYLSFKHKKMQDFYQQANYCFIDGMGLVFLGKLLGISVSMKNRITSLDFFWTLMQLSAQKKLRVFFLGAKPEILLKTVNRVKDKCGLLSVAGYQHGFFDTLHDSERVLQAINDAQPDIIFVCMGMPKQELWIVENYPKIIKGVIFNAGGLFDYIAGKKKTPPRWIGRLGFEWLFRLFTDLRLLKRYSICLFFFFSVLFHQYFCRKSHS